MLAAFKINLKSTDTPWVPTIITIKLNSIKACCLAETSELLSPNPNSVLKNTNILNNLLKCFMWIIYCYFNRQFNKTWTIIDTLYKC